MGADPSIPRPSKSLLSVRRGLERNYPGIVAALGGQATNAAQYEIDAQKAIAPQEQELNASLFERYAPRYTQAQAGAELSAIQGAGGQAVRAGQALDREIDPEYYASRAASAGKLQQLLSGLDPNRLTGAESEEVARGLRRTGYQNGELNAPSNQGAINAAMTFGSALNQKRNTVANAINTATGALPSFRSGADTFGQATGRAGTSAFGSQFGQTSNALGAGQQAAQGITGMAGGFQNQRLQLQAQRRDELDRTNETLGSLPSISCCFIFLEAYNGKLPSYVREMRDYWYFLYPELGVGYKRMAKWLVPMMRYIPGVAWLVNTTMVQPISRMGLYYTGASEKFSKLDAWIHDAWFAVWRTYAKI